MFALCEARVKEVCINKLLELIIPRKRVTQPVAKSLALFKILLNTILKIPYIAKVADLLTCWIVREQPPPPREGNNYYFVSVYVCVHSDECVHSNLYVHCSVRWHSDYSIYNNFTSNTHMNHKCTLNEHFAYSAMLFNVRSQSLCSRRRCCCCCFGSESFCLSLTGRRATTLAMQRQ